MVSKRIHRKLSDSGIFIKNYFLYERQFYFSPSQLLNFQGFFSLLSLKTGFLPFSFLKPSRIRNLIPICVTINISSNTTFRAHQELIFIKGQILRGTEYLKFMPGVVISEVRLLENSFGLKQFA